MVSIAIARCERQSCARFSRLHARLCYFSHRPVGPRPVFAHLDFQSADDKPNAHDASKGVDRQSRRGSLEEPLPPAAAPVQPSSLPAKEASQNQDDDRNANLEQKTSYYAADDETEDGAEVGPTSGCLLVGRLQIAAQDPAATGMRNMLVLLVAR